MLRSQRARRSRAADLSSSASSTVRRRPRSPATIRRFPDPGRHRTVFYGHHANRARGEPAQAPPDEDDVEVKPAKKRRCSPSSGEPKGSENSYGIVADAPDGMVLGNRITDADYGIVMLDSSIKYRDNLTTDVRTAYSGGTDVGNNN